jgi:prepilin-type processing-associated H-X9-DG protein
LTFFRTEGDAGKQQLATTAISGVLVALLLPAVQAARESARRNQSMNQMKQLVLGVLNHESAKQALPAHANYDANGKPLLSWRVHILPYVDGEALYREFHLDEPWDSAHNRALIPRMPAVYANPSLPFPPTEGKTNYLAVVGAGLAMNGTAEGVTLPQMTDGTSSTVVIVEADAERAVEWTRPDDLQFNSADPTAGLGGLRPGGFQAAYCDGHVEFVSDFMPPEMIAGMFTIAGGERIDTMHFEMTSPFNLGNQPGIDPNEFFGAGERGGRPAATEDMEDMSRGRGSVPIDQGDRGRDTSMDDMPRDREGNLIDQGERGRGTPLDDVPRDREGNPIDQGDRGRGGPTDDLPRD